MRTRNHQLRALVKRHALFGGRETVLTRLDAFAGGEGPPYAYLASDAGMGKTAMLANWIARRSSRGHETVCHFVSKPDGAADEASVLGGLCRQLLRFHGSAEELPPGGTTLRDSYTELLTRPLAAWQRLLVVIDGLDEAQGWTVSPSLFPTPLPENVRVVFSARNIAGMDWLAQLELLPRDVELIQLERLDRPNIEALLHSAGTRSAAVAAQADFVDALFKTSEGDPYYLQFLVQDVEAGRVNSASDVAMKPIGLKKYFDSWWAQLTEATSDDAAVNLLRYLLVALGPIGRDDLINISDTDELDGMSFERALTRVRRVVVGDEEIGYALSHWRFRDYLAKEHIKDDERQPYLDQLVRYCASRQQKPTRYVLQYLGQHLAVCGRWTDLSNLIRLPTWYQSHLSSDPSGASYLQDAEFADRALSEANAAAVQQGKRCPAIAESIFATLAISSIHTRARNVQKELLTALMDAGLLQPSRLIGLAREARDPDKAWILATLAPHAAAVLEEALELAGGITEKESKISALLALLQAVSETQGLKLVREAWRVAKTIEVNSNQALALASIAGVLPDPLREQAIADALQAASNVKDDTEQADALIALLQLAPEPQKEELVAHTLELALKIVDPKQKSERIAKLARASTGARSETLASQAAGIAKEIDDLPEQAELICSLLPMLDATERAQVEKELLETIRGLPAPEQVKALADLIAAGPSVVGAPELLEEAFTTVRQLPGPAQRAESFGRLAAASPGDTAQVIVDQELDAADTLLETELRTATLAALTQHLRDGLRERVSGKALDAARRIEDPSRRAVWLFWLAPYLGGTSRVSALKEALALPGGVTAVAGKLDDGLESSQLMLTLANGLSGADRSSVLHGALLFAQGVDDQVNRASALVALIRGMREMERQGVLKEAFAAALQIDDEVHKADVFAALAPCAQGDERDKAINNGVAAALKVDEQSYASVTYTTLPDGGVKQKREFITHARARPMYRLAAAASGEQQVGLINQARESLLSLDRYRQSLVLTAVADVLPEAAVVDLLRDIRVTETSEWRRQILFVLLDRWEKLASPEEAKARTESLGRWSPLAPTVQPTELEDEEALPEGQGVGNLKSVTATLASQYVSGAFRLTADGLEWGLSVRPAEGQSWPSAEVERSITAGIRSDAINECLSDMTKDDLDEALKSAAAWRDDRVPLVLRLLALGCLPAALEEISSNWGEEPPAQILAALVPYLKTFSGEALLPRAQRAARLCATHGERAAVFAMLAETSSGADKLSVCNELLTEATEAVADGSLKKDFVLKADYISAASRPSLYAVWLAVLGQKPRLRDKTLSLLAAFWPVAEALGSDQTTQESARALKEAVGRWP